MIRGTNFEVRAVMALCAAALAMASGCGDNDGIGKRYPVTGMVNYDGKPVEKGTITFTPDRAEGGRVASGTITNGSYSLTTQAPNDGALPGSYKVSVVAKKPDESVKVAPNQGGSGRNPANILKVAKAAKDLVPTKFSSPEKSGLTAVVKEQSNNIPIDLKD